MLLPYTLFCFIALTSAAVMLSKPVFLLLNVVERVTLVLILLINMISCNILLKFLTDFANANCGSNVIALSIGIFLNSFILIVSRLP